ncbi:TetR/AcrR family transcriptional regulator [Micromonospora sp. NPDC093277]|uniref:TetR/AcrR family transcriptional regulator n=1 Tax=Micromonospora sp. NPDC093277 TaxID=3364291 RepID=UPI0037FFF9CA
MAEVKSMKTRTQRAAETRGRILDAARELFITNGYGATNLQEVADRAGVAIQTIYFVFGNKRKLLKELVDVTIAGDDESIATMDRPWFREALESKTADALLRAHVQGVGEVLHRVAAITDMVATAAASDAEVAQLWPDGERPRLQVQTTVAETMVTKPGARAGITAETAADILFALLSPALYLLLVRERGWPPERWQQWTFDTLRAQLCAP